MTASVFTPAQRTEIKRLIAAELDRREAASVENWRHFREAREAYRRALYEKLGVDPEDPEAGLRALFAEQSHISSVAGGDQLQAPQRED